MRTQAAHEPVAEIRRGLEPLGNPERAVREKTYLKSELTFLGTGIPAVRRFARQFAQAHPELDPAGLRDLSQALFATEVYELRSVGIAVLELKEKLLSPVDLPWLIERVRTSPTWAHVDWLAAKVIGPVVERSGKAQVLLPRWAKDSDVWVRRTALLAQLDALRAGRGDFELFEKVAAPLLEEKEFWIRKATGWVLRDVSRKRPELTARFVETHVRRMSGLTFREATRHLPATLQKRLTRQ